MNERISELRVMGIAMAIAGAAAGVVALFLDYWSSSDGYGYTLVQRHEFVTYVLANGFFIEAAAIIAVAIASLFHRSVLLWAVSAAFGADLFLSWAGETMAPGINASYFNHASTDWGCYVGLAGAALVVAGSVLGLKDAYLRPAQTAGYGVTSTVPAAPQGPPPAGWYPDPAGSGGQRWWNGTAWTNETGFTPPG
jgi:hypothetical protein